jgi:pilus assembly protein FimV
VASLAPAEIDEFNSLADSLDLDISAPMTEAADSLTSTLADLELPELTMPDLPSSVEAQVSDAADAGLDDIGLDFDFDLNEEAKMDAPVSGALASNVMNAPLDDISLDLDAAATDSELDFAADDPVQTKIDLARAYIDMGDVEGAREILQEALQEGSSAQQDVAKTLLADL